MLTTLFAPDIGANARIMTDLAEDFRVAGHDVTVVTSHPHYAAGTASAPRSQEPLQVEDRGGVRVLRVATYLPKRRSIPARAASFVSYMLAAPRAVRRCRLEYEAVVAVCPPLTTGFAAYLAGRRRRAPYVFLIQDLYPETAIELGYIRHPLLVKAARMFADFVHGRAALCAVISEGFGKALAARGIPESRISVVPNWVDCERFRADDPERERVRAELGLEGKFTVLFAGTMGLAQGVEEIVPRAADNLREERQIAFVMLGGGLRQPAAEEAARRLGLRSVHFVPPQAHDRMAGYLAAADAFLVHLRDIPLYRVTIPSKTYEYLAMGKPILMGVAGEAAALVERAGAGLAFRPEDPTDLARAVRELAADPARCAALGGRGAAYARDYHSRRVITGAFIRETERLAAVSRGEVPA